MSLDTLPRFTGADDPQAGIDAQGSLVRGHIGYASEQYSKWEPPTMETARQLLGELAEGFFSIDPAIGHGLHTMYKELDTVRSAHLPTLFENTLKYAAEIAQNPHYPHAAAAALVHVSTALTEFDSFKESFPDPSDYNTWHIAGYTQARLFPFEYPHVVRIGRQINLLQFDAMPRLSESEEQRTFQLSESQRQNMLIDQRKAYEKACSLILQSPHERLTAAEEKFGQLSLLEQDTQLPVNEFAGLLRIHHEVAQWHMVEARNFHNPFGERHTPPPIDIGNVGELEKNYDRLPKMETDEEMQAFIVLYLQKHIGYCKRTGQVDRSEFYQNLLDHFSSTTNPFWIDKP